MRAGCLGAGARARAFGGAAVMAMVAVAAVGFPADAAPSAPAAGPCAVPTGLTARPVGPSTVRLVWRLPASLRGASVRVWRSGGVVGQTRGRSMVVRVHPGRRVTLAAGIVGPHGDAPRCRATVRALAGSRGAGSLPPPSGLAGGRLSAARVQLTWQVVPGARGYRILRDGVVFRQIPTPEFTVTLKAKRHTYRFSVASVDAAGRPGPFSRAVSLTRRHRPPAIPPRPVLTAASEGTLQVMWKPVAAGVLAGARLPGPARRVDRGAGGAPRHHAHPALPRPDLPHPGRGDRQPGLPVQVLPAAAGAHHDARADHGLGAALPAGLHRLELRRLPAELPARLDHLSHLLRLPDRAPERPWARTIPGSPDGRCPAA